jgi:hypothetical protein
MGCGLESRAAEGGICPFPVSVIKVELAASLAMICVRCRDAEVVFSRN